ncbi:hypothetical protein N431DRAFT_428056 [Stipitochalara longipes BDJ]|nr:hypothetical protein N431DRAFT_428056 [Stipitochalara longipes BDJ]
MATPPPRKRVSQACRPCGVKKIKCDGIYPTCSPCQGKAIECSYGTSKRRSRPLETDSPRPRPTISQTFRDNTPKFHPINNIPTIGGDVSRTQGLKQRAGIREVSAEVSTRLLLTYFNCIHPLWPLLYKPLYASLDYASPTDAIPPALVAAIFAIASCVDRPQPATNSIVQKYPEPWQFFEEALDLLQVGGDGSTQQLGNVLTPSITNCQVLTILSLQQHGTAEYSRAAILCGLASAMAIEMRLHRAWESNDPIKGEVQSRLWWNLYVVEKMISCEMGRPVLLRREETDCPYPSANEADEFELMSTNVGRGPAQFLNTPIKLRSISGLHTTIRLSFIMERIAREIYGISARKRIREDQAAGEAKRRELSYVLQDWEHEMDESPLRLDLSKNLTSVPASVTNYVIMWHGTILLHRPFIARWSSNPNVSDSTLSPQQVCLQAANNICFALEQYFDRLLGLPCDMVFSIFTAASTLLYQSKHSKVEDPDTQRRLKLCIHWLSALGKSWKSAGARQQLLADMFDMPRNSQEPLPTPRTVPEWRPGTPLAPQVPGQTLSPAPPRLPDAGNISSVLTPSPEDWSFLKDFGDATDEFFELDVQLRGLLDGGFDQEQFNFAT